MFEPKSAIYPAGGKNEILVAGEVEGELRNVTVTDEDLAHDFRVAAKVRDQSIAQANEQYATARASLVKRASALAVIQFNAQHQETE